MRFSWRGGAKDADQPVAAEAAPSPPVLDREVAAFIAESDLDYPPDAAKRSIAEQRNFYNAMCERFRAPRPAGMAVVDGAVEGPAGPIPVRSYRPKGASRTARVIYFHGGGYFLGGLESHDDVCAELACSAGLELVSVDYRLTPEHSFPAPYEDALAAARAIRAEGAPVIVAGDSVGGSLAASVSVSLALEDGAPVLGSLLIYPSLNAGRRDLPSYRRKAEAPMLTTDYLGWAAKLHAGAADPVVLAEDRRFRPLAGGEHAAAPPSIALAVDLDPTRDDAFAWVEALSQAGVPAAASVHAGLPHGCLRARHRSLKARAFFSAAQDGLRLLRNI